MNHGQQAGEVALSGSSKEQSAKVRDAVQGKTVSAWALFESTVHIYSLYYSVIATNGSFHDHNCSYHAAGKPTDREEVKREPLTPPKVERATEMGMIHDMTPSSFSPNVWDGGRRGWMSERLALSLINV